MEPGTEAEKTAMRDAYLELVAMDDARVAEMKPAPKPIEDMLTVGYAVSRHPLMGGEYYRAVRPAALASRDFGWHTLVAQQLGTMEGSKSKKIAGQAYGGGHVVEPDVWIIRPVGKNALEGGAPLAEIVDQMHAGGQKVICDLDDDVWAHQDWDEDRAGTDDQFEEWCWKSDAWLASTPFLADRIRLIGKGRGHDDPRVVVAPNCFDPFGLGHESHPIAGRRLGTRLWLSGRMSGDLDIYRDCFAPLLNELDLSFVHIGRESLSGWTEGPGQHFRDFVNDADMPRERVMELPSTTIPEMGRILGASINIGTIAMDDHKFNWAKTQTHAVELCSAGLPVVAATSLDLYSDVPGRVNPNPTDVRARVKYLLDAHNWQGASDKARIWARKTSVRCEATHMRALQSIVTELVNQ